MWINDSRSVGYPARHLYQCLLHTNIRLSESILIFRSSRWQKNFRMRVIFAFLRSATEIWTASFTRRHSSKNLGLVLILRVTPLARNSLFNLLVIIFYVTFLFNDLLFFSCIYKTFIRNFFFIWSWRPRTSKRRRIFSNDFKICENVFNKGFSAFFIVKLNIYRELLNHSFCKISEF